MKAGFDPGASDAMTITTTHVPCCPTAVTMRIAVMINGSERTASISRLAMSSTSPRKYPVMSPRIVPKIVASNVAAGAISSQVSRAVFSADKTGAVH